MEKRRREQQEKIQPDLTAVQQLRAAEYEQQKQLLKEYSTAQPVSTTSHPEEK
jgi:hypothetical protein